MATIYLILVIILFILAISDLIVGVSNDAVNFLNSAVGAKAATFKVIIFVAALGVLVGATFSSGMMEVARKGIFHPELFYFDEIMILFLAVMITDVILLDTFNTFGMPTSTTVSIVFELLGAAVAIAIYKIYTDPDALHLYQYINSAKAMAIISGILLSVVIAFSCGVIAQYFSRLLFSFDYEKRIKRYGWIWGGFGIMAITYFMLIKGAKGSSFMSGDLKKSIIDNTGMILLVAFIGWSFILLLLNRLFKVNILKVLVLVGTFALAMAFSGNDLVNFIGVPLAGYNSYQIYVDAGSSGGDQLLMDGLAGKVPTPTLLLLLAGIIMVITLYTSRKAKSVIKTSLDLGRQDEGYERFSSFVVSRRLVRNFGKMAVAVNNFMPRRIRNSIDHQFDQTPFTIRKQALGKEAPQFDMIRASVTLVVASILIAIGTNLKLPLSTTYVTFMVFMGTSLADGAWGRDSAVYRVSGVLSVIGGWFFTAFSAFTVAFIMAIIFKFGGFVAVIIMVLVAGAVIFRTHKFHHKRMEAQEAIEKTIEEGTLSKAKIINLSSKQVHNYFSQFNSLIELSIKGLQNEDLEDLNKAHQSAKSVLESARRLKGISNNALDRVPEQELEAGHMFILVVDYLHEMAKNVLSIVEGNLYHIDNNHQTLLPEQIDELMSMQKMLKKRYNLIASAYKNQDIAVVNEVYDNLKPFVNLTRNIRKKQIKRIKNRNVKTRNSVLYLSHLGELRNLGLFSNRVVRVFDELILNPSEDVEGLPSEIKDIEDEVKSMLTGDQTDTKKDSGKSDKPDEYTEKDE
ncbi:MAG: inorganic phosphate transporter [Bacteroidia bacterium]|nr:inorganic phosphate transporter [Bacteroidia bacterium]NNK90043.1 inorganic phosphate transporter [Saprospiraceae bacterium]